jgi:hypothetical protein
MAMRPYGQFCGLACAMEVLGKAGPRSGRTGPRGGSREAIASGRVQVTGDPAVLDRFVELFHIDPAPPVPAP